MKNIIFIAPPAAGKGTQSDLLVKKYGYNHISMGDLLRKEASEKSEIGKEVDEVIKSGNLVTDEMILKLTDKALETIEEPYIFDGFPRNMSQAKILEEALIRFNKAKPITIYLDVSKEEAFKRGTGRLNCPTCGKIYHKHLDEVKPKTEWICDDCKVDLVSRNDDSEKAFTVRYENYIEKTLPLLDYFKNKGELYVIENPMFPMETFAKIEAIIK
ncbi:MAG: nucleoside monophosphate kinase [Bacilli bacterium]|nr:nucleoside monophosphate kinase [Bacilli bacterium]MDD4795713.1 nucleoside monophosphate kinase [Bacilli bacterium]